MRKHPFQIIGTVFAAVACFELTILIVLLFCLHDPMGLSIVGGVLGFQSLVFGGIGFGFLGYQKRRRAIRESLIADGYYEMGSVVDTQRVLSVRINGRHPYRVLCCVERDGVKREYRSDMYREDPGLRPGDLVPIYLDRENEKRFYVDIESAVLALTQS